MALPHGKYQALAVTMDCNVVIQSQFAWYYITIYFQFHKSRTLVLSIYGIRKIFNFRTNYLQSLSFVLLSKYQKF
nr:MAG TPA: hypothetical protein [Caudoviricetes sp.]